MDEPVETRNRPAAKFQYGGVSAAVFLHERNRADGSVFTTPSIVVQRAYLDASGQFQNSSSFGTNDIPKAILALDSAYRFCLTRREGQAASDEQ